jgi:3-(3-hydroxy-phenyl)propionate hydroxylase
MAPRTRFTGWLAQNGFRLLSLCKPARDYFTQMKYKPPPRFRGGLILPDGRPWSRTVVGRLIPQPVVTTRNGQQLLDNLLGNGFAFIGFTATMREFLEATTYLEFNELAARRLYVTSESEYAAPLPDDVSTIIDKSGEFARGLDAAAGRVFLVRPDRYVMGAFTPALAARFASQVRSLMNNSTIRRGSTGSIRPASAWPS